jgi:hypothetical protein
LPCPDQHSAFSLDAVDERFEDNPSADSRSLATLSLGVRGVWDHWYAHAVPALICLMIVAVGSVMIGVGEHIDDAGPSLVQVLTGFSLFGVALSVCPSTEVRGMCSVDAGMPPRTPSRLLRVNSVVLAALLGAGIALSLPKSDALAIDLCVSLGEVVVVFGLLRVLVSSQPWQAVGAIRIGRLGAAIVAVGELGWSVIGSYTAYEQLGAIAIACGALGFAVTGSAFHDLYMGTLEAAPRRPRRHRNVA